MKTTLKVLALFAIFFSIVILKGCIFNPAGTEVCESCEIMDFDVSIVAYSTQDKIFENDTISYDELIIRMDANKYLNCKEITCFWYNIDFVKSAYANYYTQTFPGQIKSIEVYSNNDYDSIHPAGTLLNDLFILKSSYLNSLISEILFPSKISPALSFSIDNKYPPNSIKQHRLIIVYEEVDGTKITKELPSIYITPN